MKTKQKSAQELLDETGYRQYVDKEVLKTIPRSSGDEKVEVFTVGRWITNAELLKEYESRGLTPASLDEMLLVEKNYDYIGTIWGKNCYFACRRLVDERSLDVYSYDDEWSDFWWFAGVKSSKTKTSSDLSTLTLEKAVQMCKEAGYVVYEIK